MSQTAVRPAESHSAAHYEFRCLASGTHVRDQVEHRRPKESVFPLAAPGVDGAFLRSSYQARQLTLGPVEDGLFRFADWLPVRTRFPGSGAPVTFRSEGLAAYLGLTNLYITFSGWWPERGARIPSGTFKENEAYAVYGRMGDAAHEQVLVVASAGNTARAFLRVASENSLPLVVVVPEANIPELWTVGSRSESTIVVAAGDGSDYSDAIRLADMLCSQDGFLAEGGARNVARRDGMGTTFLSAATTIGQIPDHYFQAVGSGTGAIAAWEANLRLIEDGRFGSGRARLHLAQNAPFQVLVDSWNARSRRLILPDEENAREQVSEITAKVLANRRPPWAPVGGLFDALSETNGRMYAMDNAAARQAGSIFEEVEGIDLSPAAAVAVAALIEAAENGSNDRNDTINLNVTGGGYRRARAELDTRPLVADIVAGEELFDGPAIASAVRDLQGRQSRSFKLL